MNYIDRSRIEADWKCNRRRYWNTEYLAPGAQYPGIVKVEDATALIFGTAMHNALAGSMLQTTPDSVLYNLLHDELTKGLHYLPEQKRQELVYLGLGLFWAYVKVIKPRILANYEVQAIEREVSFELYTDKEFMCRPDLILSRKSDGTNWYPDYKTTIFKTKQWVDSWEYASQLGLGCHAVEDSLGIKMEGSMVIGLYKGYRDKNGLTRSPFTWAYHIPENGKWTPDYIRGWDLDGLWNYEPGLQHWVENVLTEETLLDQFPIAEEIAFHRDRLEDLLRQQTSREHAIDSFHAVKHGNGGKVLMASVFPQNFTSCIPGMGPACPYVDACHIPSVGEDPVGSRLYVVREPHHQPEREAYE
jgi:hypothetical protein